MNPNTYRTPATIRILSAKRMNRARRDRLLDLIAHAPMVPAPMDAELIAADLARSEDGGTYATAKGKELALSTHF